MSVTEKDLEKIAQLAKLNLSAEEKAKFATNVNKILSYVEKLNEVDTEGIEPLAHSLELTNVSRTDTLKPSLKSGDAVANAKKKSNTFFQVPKVVAK